MEKQLQNFIKFVLIKFCLKPKIIFGTELLFHLNTSIIFPACFSWVKLKYNILKISALTCETNFTLCFGFFDFRFPCKRLLIDGHVRIIFFLFQVKIIFFFSLKFRVKIKSSIFTPTEPYPKNSVKFQRPKTRSRLKVGLVFRFIFKSYFLIFNNIKR